MLVVMAIISVLATIIAGTFMQAIQRSRDGSRKNDIAQLQRSLEAYYNDHQAYPTSEAGMIQGNFWGSPFQDVNGTVYMNQLPSDKKQPEIEFLYITNTEKTKYHIMTHIENDQDSDITTDQNVIGRDCGTVNTCNYAVSSSNSTISEVLE